jgi:hypothetical protein
MQKGQKDGGDYSAIHVRNDFQLRYLDLNTYNSLTGLRRIVQRSTMHLLTCHS